MCVYIYMCAERERSSFFDARIELNSLTKILKEESIFRDSSESFFRGTVENSWFPSISQFWAQRGCACPVAGVQNFYFFLNRFSWCAARVFICFNTTHINNNNNTLKYTRARALSCCFR